MKTDLRFLFIQLALFLWGFPASDAETIYVDPAAPFQQTCGTIEAACNNILRAMQIAQSNDTIKLLPGNYSGIGNEGLSNRVNGTIRITATNVSLVGASTDSVLINCTLRDRFLLSTNNFITYLSGFSISRCKTPQLTSLAEMIGGAIYFSQSNVVIEDMVFENNFGETGGALGFDTSNATIIRSYFNYNNATVFGGAILCEKSQLNVSHSFFTRNRASGSYAFLGVAVDVVGRGGAIFTSSGVFTLVDHCDFTGNYALISGAGMQAQYTSAVDVGFSTFALNSVTGSEDCLSDSSCNNRGGALYFNDANFNVHDSQFINNSVSTTTLNQVFLLPL
jgi:predicted outer membrane repeat protein